MHRGKGVSGEKGFLGWHHLFLRRLPSSCVQYKGQPDAHLLPFPPYVNRDTTTVRLACSHFLITACEGEKKGPHVTVAGIRYCCVEVKRGREGASIRLPPVPRHPRKRQKKEIHKRRWREPSSIGAPAYSYSVVPVYIRPRFLLPSSPFLTFILYAKMCGKSEDGNIFPRGALARRERKKR